MNTKNTSYNQILKSTGIVGGTQVLSIIIGIARTKVLAIVLGPAGIGILGILQSTTELMRNATGFGINFSAVKELAEVSNTGNQKQIAKAVTILRRWAIGTGLLGMLVTIALCIPLSKYSFGSDSYALSIAIISVTLFTTSISSSQIALLQGLRKIGQMAKATLYGVLLSTSITIPLYWWLGIDGIVPGIVITSLIGLIVSWLYSSKIKIETPILSVSDTLKGGWNMARLGFFIVISGSVSIVTMYVVRALIVNKMNIDAVGYFQASWIIATVYINVVLNAMLADFFPRLSAVSNDDSMSNKLINEQLEMALIIGSPMIVSLIAFAEFAIQVLYSVSFEMAIPVLQWQLAGSFLVIIHWPLGVMFLAKNKGVFSLYVNIVWSITYFLLIFFGWDYFGFNVLGIAYFVSMLICLITVFFSTRYLGKFSFSNINLRYIVLYGATSLLTLLNVLYNEGFSQYLISSLLVMTVLLYSYTRLIKIIDIKTIVQKTLKKM
tara:strand:- start:508 stop:1989 length:1482 start_codon:yes stop_codon:yes gene_type:complete